jgi:hypothetical protein
MTEGTLPTLWSVLVEAGFSTIEDGSPHLVEVGGPHYSEGSALVAARRLSRAGESVWIEPWVALPAYRFTPEASTPTTDGAHDDRRDERTQRSAIRRKRG